jgi:GxxExxY protein
MKTDDVTSSIIRAAMRVHSQLGPGLLESVYGSCLAYALKGSGNNVKTQVPVTIRFDGHSIDAGLRLDLLVEDRVIVEVKAVEKLVPIHAAQLLSYLRLSDRQVGLLLNFNVRHMRQGIKRVVNGFKPNSEAWVFPRRSSAAPASSALCL